jgi:hypothetical protein
MGLAGHADNSSFVVDHGPAKGGREPANTHDSFRSRQENTRCASYSLLPSDPLLPLSRTHKVGSQQLKNGRCCADAAAVRYSKSTESAPVVARLTTLFCSDEKKESRQAVSQQEGASFADEYIDSAEQHYTNLLSVKIVEMRLR